MRIKWDTLAAEKLFKDGMSVRQISRALGIKPGKLYSYFSNRGHDVNRRFTYKSKNIMDLFGSDVVPEPNTGCWLWMGASRYTKGSKHLYGVLVVDGKSHQTHRLSYEQNVGPIPKGMLVCHKCDTPACVNPDHLFLGTYKDNCSDKMKKGREARGEQASKAKLNTEKVLSIRRRLKDGERKEILAEEYGVDESTIRNAGNGKYWKHVRDDANPT